MLRHQFSCVRCGWALSANVGGASGIAAGAGCAAAVLAYAVVPAWLKQASFEQATWLLASFTAGVLVARSIYLLALRLRVLRPRKEGAPRHSRFPDTHSASL